MSMTVSFHRKSNYPYWVHIPNDIMQHHDTHMIARRLIEECIDYNFNRRWTNLGYGFGKYQSGYVYKFTSDKDSMYFAMSCIGGL